MFENDYNHENGSWDHRGTVYEMAAPSFVMITSCYRPVLKQWGGTTGCNHFVHILKNKISLLIKDTGSVQWTLLTWMQFMVLGQNSIRIAINKDQVLDLIEEHVDM